MIGEEPRHKVQEDNKDDALLPETIEVYLARDAIPPPLGLFLGGRRRAERCWARAAAPVECGRGC